MYFYVVSAINTIGEGANSAQASARAVAVTPTSISLSNSGSNQLALFWPTDHTGWRLQVQTNTLAVGLNTNWWDMRREQRRRI
ncbi:MAG: hypothetical protein QM813_06495 [Verrucomicrobiota bacterium]